MTITNKNLLERIEKVFKQTNKNYTQIAVLSEHVKNQNKRIDKLETRNTLIGQRSWNIRRDMRIIIYGGGISLLTVILTLYAKFAFGV